MIYLTKGQVAMADISDEQLVRNHTWCACEPMPGKFYAQTVWRESEGKAINKKLHHMLLPKKDGFVTDHANGNSLDNRRSNLRYATMKNNAQNNTSKFRGVSFIKHLKSKPWKAVIGVDRKLVFIGHFATKEEAMSARLSAEKKHFGEFAPKVKNDV